MVDYTPLWKTIHEREITQHAMLQDKVLDNHTLDRLKRNMNIMLITLERICKYPDCTPNDVIKFTEWNCRPPFPFGWGGLQYFYTDFPYVLIKNALSMYGRPVQLYVSILILETVSPILPEMSHSLMVCRSVSMVCFFCSLMFRFTACISSSVVVDSCQPLFTIIFLDLLLVLEVSGCFSYNGMGFRLQLPFRIFLCGYSKLFSINRTVYNNISFTHLLR